MVSSVYILPHGFLPLDKEVVAAYLVMSGTQQQLYVPAIG
jgi:hypothetical protein